MSIKVLRNCRIFDGRSEALVEGGSIVIEKDVIREISPRDVSIAGATIVDMGSRFVMPGLIDVHFHVYSISLDMFLVNNMTMPMKVAHAARLLKGTLHRGYTTVRDPGGGEVGLHLAISQGLMEGPRLYYGGKALSQTGGHGDMRPAEHVDSPCGCVPNDTFAEVVDGVDDIRKFCRNELRKGADHIKIFITGGIASPTDPIWMPQYTDEEVEAAVYEAATRRKYVVAHCHTDDGARRCLRTGVRSIDHCSIITEETARLIAAADGKTYAVPTLAVQEQIMRNGPELGLYGDGLEKMKVVYSAAYKSLEYLQRAGARVGMGTDLFEERFHPMQNEEFSFRSEIFQPIDLLRSATSINAEIMQKTGIVGTLEPGAFADIVAIDKDPIRDIHVMAKPDENFAMIMKGGEFVRNRM